MEKHIQFSRTFKTPRLLFSACWRVTWKHLPMGPPLHEISKGRMEEEREDMRRRGGKRERWGCGGWEGGKGNLVRGEDRGQQKKGGLLRGSRWDRDTGILLTCYDIVYKVMFQIVQYVAFWKNFYHLTVIILVNWLTIRPHYNSAQISLCQPFLFPK